MQWLRAIATITRLPNLVFIFLCQYLLHKCVVWQGIAVPLLQSKFSHTQILLLAMATTLIAAAGYIINDYFDVKIDELNKPQRVTVELQFKRRQILLAHIILNIIGVAIAVPLALQSGHISLVAIQIACGLLLLAYSARLKRLPLSGNIAVALLNALIVVVPVLYDSVFLQKNILLGYYGKSWMVVGALAFVLTLIREIIKDLEDIKGDMADGCRTLPIAIGIAKAKLLLLGIIFAVGIAAIVCAYVMMDNNSTAAIMLSIVGVANFVATYFLQKAAQHKDYKWLSRYYKVLTFAGIVQIFFY